MADEKKNVTVKSFGLSTVLTLIFLVLKLTEHITWSWFWVFSPLLFSFVLWVLVLAFLCILIVMAANK